MSDYDYVHDSQYIYLRPEGLLITSINQSVSESVSQVVSESVSQSIN